MKLKVFFIACACLLSSSMLRGQDLTPEEELAASVGALENSVRILQKLKVSGYIQTQYQNAEVAADGINFKLANRANAIDVREEQNFGRLGVRRGRIKFTYVDGLFEGVFQPDITERGVAFKDAYFQVKDPWTQINILRAGIFDRPFGHEITYSSSRRESPERSRIFQTLFPDERDLGVMLVLRPPMSSPLNILRLDAGLFSGNGIRAQFQNKMDFIGRLSVTQPFGITAVISGGVSAYLGNQLQNNSQIFVMQNNHFVLDSDDPKNIGKYAKRQYFGADAQFSVFTPAGQTVLRAEYITGKHAGTAFNLSAVPTTPCFMRNISGGYVLFAQDFGTAPLTAILKYDWYNPNTDVSGDKIAEEVNGVSTTGANDIQMTSAAVGLLWRIAPQLRLTAYYDMVSHEKTKNIENVKTTESNKEWISSYGYAEKRPMNVFTLRLQYSF
jgi:hypothetical protein